MGHDSGFMSNKEFWDSLSRFYLRNASFGNPQKENIETAKKAKSRYIEGGLGGVPLTWREDDKTIFIDSSDVHTLIMGATGSKKSRLFVMPTVKILGEAGESVIITDPKSEIYNRTAFDLNEKGYRIFVLNFRNALNGNSWNPLEASYNFYCDYEIDKAYETLNDIATNLMSDSMHQKDPYWDYAASDVFFGLALILFRFCKDNDLPDLVNIDSLISLRRILFKGYTSENIFRAMPVWKYLEDDDIIAASIAAVINNSENTQRNILSTFDTKMRMFTISPMLTSMMSSSTIDMSSIGKHKTAIFLIMPDEKTSYHRLTSLFIKQSYESIINEAQSMHKGVMPVRINYVLDEFSSLPTIKDFPAMITASRSRNIRFNLIIQSKHQLMQRYKEETESIQSNCLNWIFLTSREHRLLSELSSLCGMRLGGRPWVEISDLQRFDKGKGEALIMADRRKPFKAALPDINEYDNNDYRVLELPQRPPITQADYDKKRRLRDIQLSKLYARRATPPTHHQDSSQEAWANDWSSPKAGEPQ